MVNTSSKLSSPAVQREESVLLDMRPIAPDARVFALDTTFSSRDL